MSQKRCSSCGLLKPTSSFKMRSHRKSFDNRCRTCRADYQAEHYELHRSRYLTRARERHVRVRLERLEWLIEYLTSHPCVDCGETDPLVLDFDHLGDKSFTIGRELSQKPWASILVEIEKCEVVCANCHARRTAERAGTLRYRISRAALQRKLF